MFASSFTLIPRVPASSFFLVARLELLISCYHGDHHAGLENARLMF